MYYNICFHRDLILIYIRIKNVPVKYLEYVLNLCVVYRQFAQEYQTKA